MTKEEVHGIYEKIHFPSVLFGKTMRMETANRICGYQLWLCAKLQSVVSYWNEHKEFAHSLHARHSAWLGVRAWLDGNRDWDICKGVNNPFLTGQTKINEKQSCTVDS